ncbi:MAG: type I-E CRISPR-associated protein Cas5/CasD [Thermoguttaceae bacterium]|nr:type I-E CRISPR-associated protein Cas5/CasD [Thermoguttaceae bacterium]
MANEKILAMYFDAPMQSYGVESRYDRRTTLPFPTRSAVTGILCAALGIERDDRDFLAKMAELTIETLELPRLVSSKKNEKKKEMIVSRLIDYHTIGGGYEKNVPAQKSNIPRKADGKPGDTVQSYREYLLDARFGILISGNDILIEQCQDALDNPKWGVWFGRKCCVPASPINQGIFTQREEAVKKLCSLAGCDKPLRVVRDASLYADGEETSMDIPVTFERSRRGTGDEYRPRRIVIELE